MQGHKVQWTQEGNETTASNNQDKRRELNRNERHKGQTRSKTGSE